MTTDPGDLVLDPTCGSGTTAYVAEQWGRRWITIDTSRAALARARARIMSAKFPWYLLADSPEGRAKVADVTRTLPPDTGFVYDRVPHITLKSIANNTEIDTIWAARQPAVEAARAALNAALAGHPEPYPVRSGGRAGKFIDFTKHGDVALPSGEIAPNDGFMEWEIPREPYTPWSSDQIVWLYKARNGDIAALGRLNEERSEDFTLETLPDYAVTPWPDTAKKALETFWSARIARQKEIDASIAARAELEYRHDKPYEDRERIRVAGPFSVESLSHRRIPAVDETGEVIEERDAATGQRRRPGAQEAQNYQTAMLDNLRKSGIHQSGRDDRIAFTALEPWPGHWLCAIGRFGEGEDGPERRAGIFLGPEYGTVQRADIIAAAREAADAGCDLLIACASSYAANADVKSLGPLQIQRARMNPDLHMAGELRAGGGNLFTIFGDPDIRLLREGDMCRVEVRRVDMFKPATGEVVSTEADDIACWFVDTDYNEEAFVVRQAYFPGAKVPYKTLRASLKAEIDDDAWASLKRTVSRPFRRPASGRIAVKVISPLGDEVMKVMGV